MGVLFLWGKATRFAQTSFPRQKSTPTSSLPDSKDISLGQGLFSDIREVLCEGAGLFFPPEIDV
jgi:hypothetical protein